MKQIKESAKINKSINLPFHFSDAVNFTFTTKNN